MRAWFLELWVCKQLVLCVCVCVTNMHAMKQASKALTQRLNFIVFSSSLWQPKIGILYTFFIFFLFLFFELRWAGGATC